MLQEAVMKPANTEQANPIVFVPKKDRPLRPFVVYRKMKGVTARDTHPLPGMDECDDYLAEARCFSTLDATTGYRWTETDERN